MLTNITLISSDNNPGAEKAGDITLKLSYSVVKLHISMKKTTLRVLHHTATLLVCHPEFKKTGNKTFFVKLLEPTVASGWCTVGFSFSRSVCLNTEAFKKSEIRLSYFSVNSNHYLTLLRSKEAKAMLEDISKQSSAFPPGKTCLFASPLLDEMKALVCEGLVCGSIRWCANSAIEPCARKLFSE